jgi:phage protein D
MIDAKTPLDYQNQSPAEIVQAICQRHGMIPATSAMTNFAGRRYAENSTVVSLSQYTVLSSDWDVLVCLGQTLGYDLFCIGNTLYFRPSITVSDTPQYVYAGSLMDLSMSRMLPLSGGSMVTISSWNSALGASVTATANSTALSTANPSDGQSAARYVGMLPNASASEAQAIASLVAQSINTEAMTIEFSMPGDMSLTTTQPLRLNGSDTAFDVTYKIDCIVRKFRPRSGFVQTVRASLLT